MTNEKKDGEYFLYAHLFFCFFVFAFERINTETKTMSEGILMTGFVAAVIACFVPLEALANLISLGTLMVFTFVDAGVILLRLVRSEGKSQDATDFKESMEQAETHSDKKQKRVIALLLVFTFSVLGISYSCRPNVIYLLEGAFFK